MGRHSHSGKSNAGQRQLRVGEEIRRGLSAIFMRGELHVPELEGASITVSEVKVSPDLKNATAFVMPLGGVNSEEVISALAELAPTLRTLVGQQIHLKFTPRLSFRLDNSFEEAGRIQTLLRQPDVVKDLATADDSDPE